MSSICSSLYCNSRLDDVAVVAAAAADDDDDNDARIHDNCHHRLV